MIINKMIIWVMCSDDHHSEARFKGKFLTIEIHDAGRRDLGSWKTEDKVLSLTAPTSGTC